MGSIEAYIDVQPGASALHRPILDEDGELIDVEVMHFNKAWSDSFQQPPTVGSWGSEIYETFDIMLGYFRKALKDGVSSQLFVSSGDEDRLRKGIRVQVKFTALGDGFLLEVCEPASFDKVVGESLGPVIVVGLPDGPGTLPNDCLMVNKEFIDRFLSGFPEPDRIPTAYNSGEVGSLALSAIQQHVINTFPDDDWETFFKDTLDAYYNSKAGSEINGGFESVFRLDGKAYFRNYYVHQIETGDWIGVWTYQDIDTSRIFKAPTLDKERFDVIRIATERLRRAIACHEIVWGPDGKAQDLRLIWSNRYFNQYRKEPAQPGELCSVLRVRFEEDMLPFVQEAIEKGESVQYFKFREEDNEAGIYDYASMFEEGTLEIETVFQYIDGKILEWGDDVDLKMDLGSAMDQQRRAAVGIALQSSQQIAARKEHDRLARELHDNSLQELFLLNMNLESLGRKVDETQKHIIEDARAAVSRISTDIRRLITDSRAGEPELINNSLKEVVDAWSSAGPRVIYSADFAVPSDVLERVPTDVTTNAVHILRECLSNAVKHSKGDRIDVSASLNREGLRFSVKDNGTGIDPRNVRASGTLNMVARAESIGGAVTTKSSSEGTHVTCTLPIAGLDAV